MNERENFIRARDNEADLRYLGTAWQTFRDYAKEEETEYNVRVIAPWRDPGLPRPRTHPDGRQVQTYSGEWWFKDDNAGKTYAPLRDEPDLFLRFASLAADDPGTKEGRLEIMLNWIKRYGVLGLVVEGNSVHDGRSTKRENLILFWDEVHQAAKCWAWYQATTGSSPALKRLSLSGKTLAEKRRSAAEQLGIKVSGMLKRECFPKLYYEVRQDTGETAKVELSWGFRSLLGAMYLQLAWRIKSRQCGAPGCSNIIGLHERCDKIACSDNCKERRRYHLRKEAAARSKRTS
jgi:hypothetical protein